MKFKLVILKYVNGKTNIRMLYLNDKALVLEYVIFIFALHSTIEVIH